MVSALVLLGTVSPVIAFHATTAAPHRLQETCLSPCFSSHNRITSLFASSSQDRRRRSPRQRQQGGDNKGGGVTLKELAQKMVDNPAKYFPEPQQQQQKKKKTRRTRRRVENPQQSYLYAEQRRALLQEQEVGRDNVETAQTHPKRQGHASTTPSWVTDLLRELNMAPPSTLHCDPIMGQEPKILGRVCLLDEQEEGQDASVSSSHAYAYLIDKPAGWAILGSKTSSTAASSLSTKPQLDRQHGKQSAQGRVEPETKRVKVVDEIGAVDYLEYSEQAVFDMMTAEEIQEFLEDGGELPEGVVAGGNKRKQQDQEKQRKNTNHQSSATVSSPQHDDGDDATNRDRLENLKRIQRRAAVAGSKMGASGSAFVLQTRPSVVNWLKSTLASEDVSGRTIVRGGNFWKALAGATSVDDSGVVLLCPKTATDKLFCESSTFVAVVGNGGNLASTAVAPLEPEQYEADVMAKVKRGRGEDAVEVVRIHVPEQFASCDQMVSSCQEVFDDGIRGDPLAHPLERRAHRRLVHCESMIVSSLVGLPVQEDEEDEENDYSAEVSTDMPEDMAVLSERRNQLTFSSGAFLGRRRQNSAITNAYREINGAADGFPGWTVDRYNKWLFVQHDPMHPRGPLPSIHDGKTAGVYYLEAWPDRSSMGSGDELSIVRPRLLEGQAAPSVFPILENGIRFMVSLDKDLSTGLFLDQRAQRQWLAQNCRSDTRVLNCFAHTGAFSVAAATAGASTVSLDLSQKWLERLPKHFEANGLEFDERHDAIYGDCFEWLARLSKRKEQFDVVILDPPSSSVSSSGSGKGRKRRRRWSVKNDMDELVSLAAPLVAPGGLLWTSTNHAGLSCVAFARLCRKGFDRAQEAGSCRWTNKIRLERLQPMPSDFQTIGPHNVKNLVWRFPA